jgi:hypothetical protein
VSQNPRQESCSQTAGPRPQSGRIQGWVDTIAKLSTPITAIIAAVAACAITNPLHRQTTAVTLVSEREKAESQLRADMFQGLIEPIAGPKIGVEIPPDREQLLVELLALNFHEHFEMKPLLQRVDQNLKKIRNKRIQEDRREALRSIVRRIIDRQVAALERESGSGGDPLAKVYTLILIDTPEDKEPITTDVKEERESYIEALSQQPGVKKGKTKVAVLKRGSNIEDVVSADQRYRLAMAVTDVDWERQEVKAVMNRCPLRPAECGPPLEVFPISASWADLPFTDNTLFADGNRFALTVYRVAYSDSEHPETPLNTAWLKFIWFPRNYYTPRERPFDQDQFLYTVGKTKGILETWFARFLTVPARDR